MVNKKQPTEQPTYTLTCVKCGEIFYDEDGFLDPMLCPKCRAGQPEGLTEKLLKQIIIKYCDAQFDFTKGQAWLEIDYRSMLQELLAKLHTLGYGQVKAGGELKKELNKIFDACYSRSNPSYPDLKIFQRQKALNEIIVLLSGYKSPQEVEDLIWTIKRGGSNEG